MRGRRTVPWLILTNANHVVRAEGFALREVDRKLTEFKAGR